MRPRFFLDASPGDRARILAHELWHIGPEADGRLHPERRHGARSEATLEAELDALLAPFDPTKTSLWPLLGVRGELALTAWLVRPPGSLQSPSERRRYTERDMFTAIVRQE